MYLTKKDTVLKMKELKKLDWYKYAYVLRGTQPACGSVHRVKLT